MQSIDLLAYSEIDFKFWFLILQKGQEKSDLIFYILTHLPSVSS